MSENNNNQLHECPNGGTCVYYKELSKEVDSLKLRIEKNEASISEAKEDVGDLKIQQATLIQQNTNFTKSIDAINTTLTRMNEKFDRFDEKLDSKFTLLDQKIESNNKELSDKIELVRIEACSNVNKITEPWKKMLWSIAEKVVWGILIGGFAIFVTAINKGWIKF